MRSHYKQHANAWHYRQWPRKQLCKRESSGQIIGETNNKKYSVM